MQYSLTLLAAGLVAQTGLTWAAPQAKNFIYIVPDGYGQASQTMARDYVSLQKTGSNASAPIIQELAGDRLVLGTVRTHASDNLVTDSAASGTAFSCGHKTYNDAISVTPDGQPVGSILEAAKLDGFKTALVVTSTINHATPAVYSAHVANRDSYEAIAAQQIGYSHPFGPVVDILLGGGRCYFKPQSDPTSCRSDDLDLFSFAQKKGYHVMQDRAAFDAYLGDYTTNASLPYIGLFNDDQMMYEIDRSKAPEKEPSLLEMSKAALGTLDQATRASKKGYFIMIEASRIDHAGHANDAAAHVHDTVMYNEVLGFVQEWINAHPDTMLMSAADHECGGLTTNAFDPAPLVNVQHSFEYLKTVWEAYNGTDARGYFTSTVLPAAGLSDATDAQIDKLLGASSPWAEMKKMIATKAGVNWSTGGHTATDVTLHGYAAGKKWREFKGDMAGNHDNTELPRYIEKVLKLDMDATTAKLRAVNGSWVAGPDAARKRRDVHSH
ncbi:alkaline phosphatase [Paraphaeosphaeria sporulosa]